MNKHPLKLGINLTKIGFASPSHLEERSQVLKTSGKKLSDFHCHVLCQECHMVKILDVSFKCRGHYMYFYTEIRLGINVSHTLVKLCDFHCHVLSQECHMVKILEASFKCRGYYMYFYTEIRLEINVSHPKSSVYILLYRLTKV